MAAMRGVDGRLITPALAEALATLQETKRRDDLEAETVENTQRVEHTPHCSRKRRGISMYLWLGAACWKLKTSLIARALRRSSFEPTSAFTTYPFFLELIIAKALPYIKRLQQKQKNCIFDPTCDKKGSYPTI